MVALGIGRHVDVLAQLQIAFSALDEGAAVAPGAQPVGREPVDAEVSRGPVVHDEGSVAEVLEVGILGELVAGQPARCYPRVLRPREEEYLLYLVATQVDDDAAVFLPVEKPGGALGQGDPVRTRAYHLDHFPDRPFRNEFFGVDGSLDMEAFAVVDAELSPRFPRLRPRGGDVGFQCERRLVTEIVLAMIHNPQAQASPQIGHGRGHDHPDRRILENRPLVGDGLGSRELRPECCHLGRIGIPDLDGFGSRLGETVAHAVDVAMIEAHHPYPELPRPADGLCLALGRVELTIGFFLHS